MSDKSRFIVTVDGAWQGASFPSRKAAEDAATRARTSHPGKEVEVQPKTSLADRAPSEKVTRQQAVATGEAFATFTPREFAEAFIDVFEERRASEEARREAEYKAREKREREAKGKPSAPPPPEPPAPPAPPASAPPPAPSAPVEEKSDMKPEPKKK